MIVAALDLAFSKRDTRRSFGVYQTRDNGA